MNGPGYADDAPAAFVMTHESDPQRTIKSTSIIALTITRSLGRQGVPVVRIHPNRMDRSLTSKYCSRVEVSPDLYESEQDTLDFLISMRQRYVGPAILIPASDDCAYFISKHHAVLSQAFAVMASPWDVMSGLVDKQKQYAYAHGLGIPIPETYFPGDIAEVNQLAHVLPHYPYVIKPLVAHAWRRAGMKEVSKGNKGFAVHTPQELIDKYRTIASGDRQVMIQEVIGGADDRLFTFLSYFDAQSKPLAYCVRKKIRQLPVDFGYCTLTVSCFDPAVVEQSLRLLQGLGFHGMSGVEWKLDPRTGQYKLIEINGRAVNTIGIGAACGVDLPYIAFRDMARLPVTPVTGWEAGAKWINVADDVWAARTLHQRGALSLREWWRSIIGPGPGSGRIVDAVYAADDLRPFVGYFLERFKAPLVRRSQRVGAFMEALAAPLKNTIPTKERR